LFSRVSALFSVGIADNVRSFFRNHPSAPRLLHHRTGNGDERIDSLTIIDDFHHNR
jgi:hypothetical protein